MSPDPVFETIVLDQLKQLRGDIKDLDERVDSRLGKIEEHQKIANGKVGALELWRARWEGASGTLKWIPTFLIAVGGGGVGVLVATLVVHH